jgi:transposase
MRRDGRSWDHRTLEAIRLMAVERVRDGERPSSVIASFGINRTTINRWLDAASKPGLGLSALHCRSATGRPRSLTSRQEQQVFRWINGCDPRQYGLDFGLWTPRQRSTVSMSCAPACPPKPAMTRRPCAATNPLPWSRGLSAVSRRSIFRFGRSITGCQTGAHTCCSACWPITSNGTCVSASRQCCSMTPTTGRRTIAYERGGRHSAPQPPC